MNLLRAATLTVRDPAATAARYAEWMDYAVVEDGAVDGALAASWGTPAVEGRPYVVCRPASGAPVYLRFIQGDPPTDYRPLRTYGWAAVELCVQDTLAVAKRMAGSPFEIIGPPRPLDGMADIFPMQVRGPDDEIVYLTQIIRQPEGARLASATSAIDRPFILVLACPDLETDRAWFAQRLGLKVGAPFDLRYTMISKAFGLPIETKHTLCTAGHDLDVFLELDRYPPEATPRSCRPGELPPGVAIVTLERPAFADLANAVPSAPDVSREGAIYAGQPHTTLRTPGGALVELVAAS